MKPNFDLVQLPKTLSLEKVSDPQLIIKQSLQLVPREIRQIVKGFESESYEMVSLFVWTRAITVLKSELSKLGMQFVGEMLGRPDITDNSSIDSISESEAVTLAESLGIVTSTEAMRLRQAQTVVGHFSKPRDKDIVPEEDIEMTKEEAISCLRTCVKNILGQPAIQLANEFVEFREKLSSTTLKKDAPDIEGLLASPYFFKRTTLYFLLAASKNEQGAQLTHVLNNFITVLPVIWDQIKANDRWQVGNAYAEAYSAGRESQVSGMKKALLQVKGFDYVPETTRSNTFTKAAQKLLAAHEGMNNYYNEPSAITELQDLGTVIPMPAFPVCMRAILSVFLGNSWGYSFAAETTARSMLTEITNERWRYFLDECLPNDQTLLFKLGLTQPSKRWCTLVKLCDLEKTGATNHGVKKLIVHGLKDNDGNVRKRAGKLNAVASDKDEDA
jgi:hypothetical protein